MFLLIISINSARFWDSGLSPRSAGEVCLNSMTVIVQKIPLAISKLFSVNFKFFVAHTAAAPLQVRGLKYNCPGRTHTFIDGSPGNFIFLRYSVSRNVVAFFVLRISQLVSPLELLKNILRWCPVNSNEKMSNILKIW